MDGRNILLLILSIVYGFNITNTNIKLGGLFSLSTENGVSEKGVQRLAAYNLAISEVNLKYNINMSGVYYDDKGGISEALKGSVGFINSGVDIIIGPASSSLTESVAYLSADFNIPVISYASSSPFLSNINKFPTLVRTVASDIDQANAIIALAVELKWDAIGLIGTEDIYGSFGVNTINNRIPSNTVIGCKFIIRENNYYKDIVSAGKCLSDRGIKVVVLFMNEINSSNVISKLRGYGNLSDDILLVASDSWAASDAVFNYNSLKKDFVKNSIGIVQYYGDDNWFVTYFNKLNPATTLYKEFGKLWEEKFKCSLSTGDLCANDVSIRNGKCKCTLNEELNVHPNPKLSFVYDSVNLVGSSINKLLHDCTFGDDICNKQEFTASDILYAIRHTIFTGKSGDINILDTDRVGIYYTYYMYDGNKWVSTGEFTSKGEIILDKSMLFLPDASIKILEFGLDNPVATIIVILVSSGVICSICIIIFFFTRSKELSIKLYSNVFSLLMIIGINTIWVSLILWLGDTTGAKCAGLRWCLWLGISLVVAILLSKNFRVWKIYSNKSYEVTKMGDKDILLFTVMICGIEIIILISGIFYGYTPDMNINSFDPMIRFETCGSGQTAEWASIIYIFVLVLSGCVIAFLTRNVDVEFNESKHIAFCMYSIFLNIVILIPIKLIDFTNVQYGFYIRNSLNVLIIYFGTIVIFLILFVPKLVLIYNKQNVITKRRTNVKEEPNTFSSDGHENNVVNNECII